MIDKAEEVFLSTLREDVKDEVGRIIPIGSESWYRSKAEQILAIYRTGQEWKKFIQASKDKKCMRCAVKTFWNYIWK